MLKILLKDDFCIAQESSFLSSIDTYGYCNNSFSIFKYSICGSKRLIFSKSVNSLFRGLPEEVFLVSFKPNSPCSLNAFFQEPQHLNQLPQKLCAIAFLFCIHQ